MRSKRGFFGAAVLLLALPLTVLSQIPFPNTDAIVVHILLATSFALFSAAVFDFETTKWLARGGAMATGASAAIFLVQGISETFPDEAWLHTLAFDVAGQGLESALVSLFVVWCLALLRFDSWGKTRIYGVLVMTLVVCMELYSYGLALFGEEPPEVTRLLYLLPVVWLLLESRKPASSKPQGTIATSRAGYQAE
jgi:hypothetical protein